MLLLLYIDKFRESGLEELWLQYDISEGSCIIPFHLWYTELAPKYCKVLIQALTGNDFCSVIGMNLAVIKLNPL